MLTDPQDIPRLVWSLLLSPRSAFLPHPRPRARNSAPLVSPSSRVAALRTTTPLHPPLPGCGAPGLGSRQGKFLRPGPAEGGGCCRRLCGKGPGARSPLAPRRPPPRVGTPDLQTARPFRQPEGGGGRFAASAARRAPCGPLGAPCVRSCLGNLPRGGSARPAPSPKTPCTRQEHAVWLPVCRARWRGRERRGQCLLLLTKGSRSSSPAERLAVLHPASPSRHRRAPRPRGVGTSLAARCGLRVGSGAGRRGDRGGRCGRCRRGCSRAQRLQSPSCSLGAAGPASNKWRRTPRAQPPTCGAPAAAGAALGPPCLYWAPLRLGCAFCLHARGHTVT